MTSADSARAILDAQNVGMRRDIAEMLVDLLEARGTYRAGQAVELAQEIRRLIGMPMLSDHEQQQRVDALMAHMEELRS